MSKRKQRKETITAKNVEMTCSQKQRSSILGEDSSQPDPNTSVHITLSFNHLAKDWENLTMA